VKLVPWSATRVAPGVSYKYGLQNLFLAISPFRKLRLDMQETFLQTI
jgi:hypothetical protein